MPSFRLHFEIDGVGQKPRVLDAATPDEARKALSARHPGATVLIHKVKLDREGASA